VSSLCHHITVSVSALDHRSC